LPGLVLSLTLDSRRTGRQAGGAPWRRPHGAQQPSRRHCCPERGQLVRLMLGVGASFTEEGGYLGVIAR
jgi:hypothetical protein